MGAYTHRFAHSGVAAISGHHQTADNFLVYTGEQSGALETIYDRIATYKEKAEALKSKIKKAMFYPIAVLVVAFIVTTILLIFVVPQFEEIFSSFGADLPRRLILPQNNNIGLVRQLLRSR